MNYLPIDVDLLRSCEFLGCEPTDRSTWISLMGYCGHQENGGRIKDCGDWGDRKWQQVAGITLKEVNRTCDMWRWDGEDLELFGYPEKVEATLLSKRESAAAASRKRWAEHEPKPRKTRKTVSEHESDVESENGIRKRNRGRNAKAAKTDPATDSTANPQSNPNTNPASESIEKERRVELGSTTYQVVELNKVTVPTGQPSTEIAAPDSDGGEPSSGSSPSSNSPDGEWPAKVEIPAELTQEKRAELVRKRRAELDVPEPTGEFKRLAIDHPGKANGKPEGGFKAVGGVVAQVFPEVIDATEK